MIKVKDLVKTYPNNIRALEGVSFQIEPGEVCGYLGANGAGKSTTIKILAGMLQADSGNAEINEVDLFKYPERVKRVIGYVPESGAVFPSLSPYDFLEFVCKIYNVDKSLYRKKIIDFMEIFDLKNEVFMPMSGFSKGMKQKVLIISSLIHNPDIILWDEPLSGVDFNTNLVIRDLVKELSSKGKIILYSTHVLDMLDKICNKIIILSSGKIVYDSHFQQTDGVQIENILKQYVDSSASKEKAAEIYKNIISS